MAIELNELPRSKNVTKDEVTLRGIHSPKGLENKLRRFNRYMIKEIRTRFENQVLAKLNKTTQSKFTDSKNQQIGNYAKIYDKFYRRFEKSINKQFSPERIGMFISTLYRQVYKQNKDQFTGTVNSNLGINLDDILKTDGLNTFVNAKSLESGDMLKKLKNETMTAYKANVLRRMSAGDSLDDLYKQVKEDTNFRLNRADLIARNELKAFNSDLTKRRATNLGITKAKWQTVQDERTRECHKRFNGEEYVIGKGLYCSESGQWEEPGEAINCRCVSLPIVEFD